MGLIKFSYINTYRLNRKDDVVGVLLLSAESAELLVCALNGGKIKENKFRMIISRHFIIKLVLYVNNNPSFLN